MNQKKLAEYGKDNITIIEFYTYRKFTRSLF